MTRQEKIAAAKDILGGVDQWGKRMVYLAPEVDSYYYVTEKDLVALYDMTQDSNPEIRRDAYSHWCASYGAEVPARTQKKIRDYVDA